MELDFSQQSQENQKLIYHFDNLAQDYAAHRKTVSEENLSITTLTARIQSLTPSALELADNHNLRDLEEQLQAQVALKKPFAIQQQEIERNIAIHEDYRTHTQAAIKEHQEYLHALTNHAFLTQLRDCPEKLVEKLADDIQKRFEAYDSYNPSAQSVAVRICLAELAPKITFIKNLDLTDLDNEPGTEYKSDQRLTLRHKYYQLCGLLWNMCNRLSENRENHALFDEIESAFSPAAIDKAEGLKAYAILQRAYPSKTHEMTPLELHSYEMISYGKILTAAKTPLPHNSQSTAELKAFHTQGDAVISAINVEKIKHFNLNPLQCDLKFFTILLKKTLELRHDPSNLDIQNDYRHLIELEQSGKASLCKLISGGMLMFLGIALIIASTAGKVAAFDLPTFETTGGMIIGTAMLLGGFGLYRSGRAKGLSKKMETFAELAKKIDKTNMPPEIAIAVSEQTPLLPKPSAPPSYFAR